MSDGKLLEIDVGVGGLTTSARPRALGDDLHSETMIVSMGPTHPATHGTIRIVTELSGEKIVDADVDVGYLHRGFEKMCETVDYNQVMPYTDRLNYVSPVINNFGWCLTVEKLLGIEAPKRAQYIRVLLSEISRVSDHLTCLGASAMELGAFKQCAHFVVGVQQLDGEFLYSEWCLGDGFRQRCKLLQHEIQDNSGKLLRGHAGHLKSAVREQLDVHFFELAGIRASAAA